MNARMLSLNAIRTIQNDTHYDNNTLIYFTKWEFVCDTSLDDPIAGHIYKAVNLPVEMVIWDDGVLDFNEV